MGRTALRACRRPVLTPARGHKLDERQVRKAAHDGLGGKPQVERLDGTDDVTSVKTGRG